MNVKGTTTLMNNINNQQNNDQNNLFKSINSNNNNINNIFDIDTNKNKTTIFNTSNKTTGFITK